MVVHVEREGVVRDQAGKADPGRRHVSTDGTIVTSPPDTCNDDGSVDATNTIYADPLFVNDTSSPYNFDLQAGSPAIDAAAPVTSVTTDYAGTPRPQGSAPDIGAYEFVASGPTVSLYPAASYGSTTLGLNFGAEPIGTTSSPQLLTVTNTGTTNLTWSQVTLSNSQFAFAGVGTYGVAYPVSPGSSCTISVNFTPTASGTQNATLSMTDNASNSPQVYKLRGIGGSSVIAHDNATSCAAASASPATCSYAVGSAGNAIVLVGIMTADTVTSVTYNGTQLTKAGSFADGEFTNTLYYLTGAPSGQGTVSVAFTGSGTLYYSVASYTGAGSVNPAVTGSGSLSGGCPSSPANPITITTKTAGSWVVESWTLIGGGQAAYGSTNGTNLRVAGYPSSGVSMADSGAVSTPGSVSLYVTGCYQGGVEYAGVMVEVVPQ
jgi:hypothetical protein